MKTEKNKFYKTVLKIAVPVTLQALLQSSFGIVDQIMEVSVSLELDWHPDLLLFFLYWYLLLQQWQGL